MAIFGKRFPIVVDQERLEVVNFDIVALACSDYRLHLDRVSGVVSEQLLYAVILQQHVLGEAEDVKGFLPRHELASDSESSGRHFLLLRVGVPGLVEARILLFEIVKDPDCTDLLQSWLY